MVLAYRIGGRPLFKVILAPVIVFYYALDRRARNAARNFLKVIHDFDQTMPAANAANGFRMFWQFGLVLIDKFAVWMGRIVRSDVQIQNNDLITHYQEQGQGVVFLLSHLGNFEVSQALSGSNHAVKLTVLVYTEHAEKFNKVLSQFANSQTVELLTVSNFDMATSIMLSERVSRGEFIAIAGDRVALGGGDSEMVEFFGKPAPFPTGPFMLASILSVPIVMLTCFKVEGRYQIYFDKLSDGKKHKRKERQRHVRSMVQQYAQLLQTYTKQAPLQWFNFFDFWQLPDPAHAVFDKDKK